MTSCSQTNVSDTNELPQTENAESTETANNADPLWENALYTEDTELGEGSKTIVVLVQAGEKTVKFTLKTDAEFLGTALEENGLIVGKEGPYGIMIEKVNGIQAIYEKDKAYWALFINSEYATSGIDATPVNDGDEFWLVYTLG
jgi:hypothetical protein